MGYSRAMSRFRPPAEPATLTDAHQAVLKLSRDIASLERTVQSLAKRLKMPPDPDMDVPTVESMVMAMKLAATRHGHKDGLSEVTQIRDIALAADYALDEAHRHIAMMRAHMDVIENSAQLRDDFKHWLAEPDRSNR